MSLNDRPVRFRVREFEWFQIETKVRSIIHELLTPVMHRHLELDTRLVKNNDDIQGCERTLVNLQKIVYNSKKVGEIPIFQAIEQQLNSLMLQDEHLRQLFDHSSRTIETQLTHNQSQLAQFTEIVKELLKTKVQIQEVGQGHVNKFQELASLNRQNNSQIRSELDRREGESSSVHQRIEERLKKLQKFMSQSQIAQQKMRARTMRLQEQAKLSQAERLRTQLKFGEINAKIEEVDRKLDIIKQLSYRLDKCSSQIYKTRTEARLVFPLLVHSHISQALKFSLTNRQKRRFTIFQYGQLRNISKENLQMTFINDQLFNYEKIMFDLNRANHKEISGIKRDKLREMGIDPILANSQQEDEALRLVLQQKDESVKTTVLKEEGESIRNEQQLKVLISTLVEQQRASRVREFSQLRESIRDNHEMIHLQLQKREEDSIKAFEKCMGRSISSLEQSEALKKQMSLLQHQTLNLKEKFKLMEEYDRNLVQYLALQHHLQVQDQSDRKSIALMGLQENFQETHIKRRPIGFREECISCSGIPSTTWSAFKLACLSYNPSQVLIQGKRYSRDEVLTAASKLLQFINGLSSVSQQQKDRQREDKKVRRMSVVNSSAKRVRTQSEIHNKSSGGHWLKNVNFILGERKAVHRKR